MKVDTSKVGLVRGYLIYAQWRAGRISIEDAKDEDNVCVGVAYTPWHRHDEDPSKVEDELNMLSRCYATFDSYEGAMLGFEYKEYRK